MNNLATTKDTTTLKNEIQSLLDELGISSAKQGYQLLTEALLISCTSTNVIELTMSKLYTELAEKHGLNYNSVKKSIAYSISAAWKTNKSDFQEQLFGPCIYSKTGKPSNQEFIFLITDRFHLTNSIYPWK